MNGLHKGTAEELRPVLLGALRGLREDDQRHALDLIPAELDRMEPTEEEARHRKIEKDLLSKNYYAIHDDDLNVLEQCVAVAGALYAGIPEPISVVGGLAVFLYRYRRKRAKLSPEQGIVLRTLTYAPSGGWTIAQLLGNAPLSRLKPAPDVAAVLDSLKRVVQNDGDTTAFVAEEGDRWRAVDV
jgi:hypothetical protein